MKPKVTILLNKTVSSVGESCPTATKDVEENIKNRDWTIDNFGYGPLNPASPDPGFWEKKAELWNSDIETVKTALCISLEPRRIASERLISLQPLLPW